ncbi:BatA domain-containing protein [Winogradskyella sp. DF17]|uniref:BatA domain-containing protein n=1 Tax=Winogradskyella pelagia TaxID=2819984 RepID=A0ABS3T469_9FLAO|nr:BatA domain-containing protein [Winogradskyella sp. DF17]MBO3117531.1 BatA domain-containing protein [Winogradskyella sp. DF17]
MQFKHPELLYALLLLIIPILIHLFQLRRFQKVKFTNVKLLKQINLQTRKSSKLKKWLVLFTRLSIIGFVVLAFAQPFIPNTSNYNKAQETVIYLDNSFSMQAIGKNGSLLNEAIQNLLTSLPNDEKLSVFTNDNVFKNTSIKAIKNDLIALSFSHSQIGYQSAYLKGKQLFSDDNSSTKNLVLVSDFQQQNEGFNIPTDSIINLKLVQQKPNINSNISVDSVYVKSTNGETLELAAVIRTFGDIKNDVSVSLFNNEELLAKNMASFVSNTSEVVFSVPNNAIINGKLTIEDGGLNYDNTFYFNINEKPKIKVLSISDETDNGFLNRIYTSDEFEFLNFDLDKLNFNLIPNQNLLILNEVRNISDALKLALVEFKKDGGSIVIIPSIDADLDSYNGLLKQLNAVLFTDANNSAKRITKINFNHPLLENTFYSQVTNFQYPKAEMSFTFSGQNNPILSFEDDTPFLTGRNEVYTFAAPINKTNSNFINSQLIVPVLYNMGLQSLPLAKLYYQLGTKNDIAIKTTLGQDDILTLESTNSSVIPLQKTYSTSVVLQVDEFPKEAGILTVKNNDLSLQNLSFNYPRHESQLAYFNLEDMPNVNIDNSLIEAIDSIKSNTNVNALWKWFVIFALAFLMIEMFLLKYLK